MFETYPREAAIFEYAFRLGARLTMKILKDEEIE